MVGKHFEEVFVLCIEGGKNNYKKETWTKAKTWNVLALCEETKNADHDDDAMLHNCGWTMLLWWSTWRRVILVIMIAWTFVSESFDPFVDDCLDCWDNWDETTAREAPVPLMAPLLSSVTASDQFGLLGILDEAIIQTISFDLEVRLDQSKVG